MRRALTDRLLPDARVLAEIGDDPSRFTDAKGLKAFARAAPVTRACGRSLSVMAHQVKKQRLPAAGYLWAFSSLLTRRESPLRPPTRNTPYPENAAFPPSSNVTLVAA